MQDRKIAEILLQWADEQFLAQAPPNSPTSLRSDRVIDYAFVRGLNLDIQVFNGNTTSDQLGKNIHWKIRLLSTTVSSPTSKSKANVGSFK
ncbi:unnamed protein product [Rotaria sordida]|uniref:Uncharacterized protein n=1 Tax=Rotaria sordida TaxID=392033 RepID=A0A814NC64_9BILA|nr:unnamed protein product [Rotaria sordida]